MTQHKLDKLDKKILKMISKDARIAFLEIARECNVSGAAIHQRIQKLKNLGIIKGSEFIIDTYKIGYQTCAYVGIVIADMNKFEEIVDQLRLIPEIVECHYATGKYSIFIKIYAIDNRHLLKILLEKLIKIDGVKHTETFQISLDELFNRQLTISEEHGKYLKNKCKEEECEISEEE